MESKTFTSIVPVTQVFFNEFPFRIISAGNPPNWWGRLLIRLGLTSPEKLGYLHTEFPIVLNTDILKPGDYIVPKCYSRFQLWIQSLPESGPDGYKYYVAYPTRDLHTYYPNKVVRPGAIFVRAMSSGKNPILAQ